MLLWEIGQDRQVPGHALHKSQQNKPPDGTEGSFAVNLGNQFGELATYCLHQLVPP